MSSSVLFVETAHVSIDDMLILSVVPRRQLLTRHWGGDEVDTRLLLGTKLTSPCGTAATAHDPKPTLWAKAGLRYPTSPVSYTHLTLPTNREV